MLNEGNISEKYQWALSEYDFDMEAYADLAQNIVLQNMDNPARIGELMLVLHNEYNRGDL